MKVDTLWQRVRKKPVEVKAYQWMGYDDEIVSVKTRNVEPVQALKERYQALVDIVGADNAVASPGCGFASAGESRIISLESAKRKLTNLATAVKEVREVKA